jgi:hypothetical protein
VYESVSDEHEEPILYDPERHARQLAASGGDPRKTTSAAAQLAQIHAGHRRVDAGCSAVLAAVLVPRYLAPWLGLGWYLLPVAVVAAVVTGALVGRFGNGAITEAVTRFFIRVHGE